jgi:phage-related protein (TIGR01555 family)
MLSLYDALDTHLITRAPQVASGMPAALPGVMQFQDNLQNLVSQLGTAADKGANGQFVNHWLEKHELEAMYYSDWLAGTIIDAVADDMTRAWRKWKGGKKQVPAMERAEKKLKVRQKVATALRQARLYGGSGIYIGTRDTDVSKPLDLDRLKKGGITYLHVLSRWELWAGALDRDPLSPHFGEPIFYEIVSAGSPTEPAHGAVQIHPSRVVRFQGIPQLEMSRQFDGWGFPILQRVYDAVRNAAAAQGALASLMQEAKVDVVKIRDLTRNSVDAGWRQAMIARFSLAKQAKSINGMFLLDAEEEYEQKKISLADTPKVLAAFLEVACGAASMPVTRLLGQPPGGLNASGDSNIRHWYDTVNSKQTTELGPDILRLDEALERHAGVSPGSVDYEWVPLWQMTEAEKAAISLQKAQATQVIAATGTVPFPVLAKSAQQQMVADNIYPGLADGLENAPPVTAPPAPAALPADGSKPANPSTVTKPTSMVSTEDAGKRTLYVSRRVLNGEQIATWAKQQGFATTIDPDDMHVTVAFSRQPVDWWATKRDMEGTDIPPGARELRRFGDAVVLTFGDAGLAQRWQAFRDAGASWDHEGYVPHVTVTYAAPAGMNLDAIRPFGGPILLGPEEYAEVQEDWQSAIRES